MVSDESNQPLFHSLAPPPGSEAAEQRLLRQLRATHGILTLSFAFVLLTNSHPVTQTVSGLMVLFFIALMLITEQQTALVRILTPLGPYLILSFLIIQGFGIYSITVPSLTVVLILAALFGNRLAMLVYLGLCLLTVVVAFFMEQVGYIHNGQIDVSTYEDLANVCVIYLGIGGLLWVLLSAMENDRNEAWEKSQSLEQSNLLLKQETEARRSTERIYRLLAENSSDFIWTIDLDLNYTYSSPAATSVLGYSPDELIGTSILDIFEEDEREALVNLWVNETRLELAEPGSRKPIRTTRQIQDRQGNRRWVESSVAFMRDESGQAIGMVGTTRDVDERVALEQKREEIENQLRQAQKIESIGQLAGGVAHDFNNLLLAISGYAELILLEKQQPKSEQYAKEIVSVTERAAKLTRQLLTFSRQQPLETQRVDVGSLVQDMRGLLNRLIPATVSIEYNISPEEHIVEADPAQLEQVVVNLCLNARDAVDDAGSIQVNLSTEFLREHARLEPGSYMQLEVKDTGVGMDPMVVERIFDPFFTTKPQGKGTGLGLSVVHGIVTGHDGDITVESRPGDGTSFRILLPAVTGESTRASGSDNRIQYTNDSDNAVVLIVDDDPQVTDVIERAVQYAGHRSLRADNGRSGLAVFEENASVIDLIITDTVMPEMDGLNFAEEISHRAPDLPIILMSGYQQTYPSGASSRLAFLRKPFSTLDLLAAIDSALKPSENGSPTS